MRGKSLRLQSTVLSMLMLFTALMTSSGYAADPWIFESRVTYQNQSTFKIGDQWDSISGSIDSAGSDWKVASTAIQQSNSWEASKTKELRTKEGSNWWNCSIEADFKHMGFPTTSNNTPGKSASIMLGISDDGARYEFTVKCKSTSSEAGTKTDAYIYKRKSDGTVEELAGPVECHVTQGTADWTARRMKGVVSAGTVSLYEVYGSGEEKLLLTYDDPEDLTGKVGKAGIKTYGATGYFNNIYVRQITPVNTSDLKVYDGETVIGSSTPLPASTNISVKGAIQRHQYVTFENFEEPLQLIIALYDIDDNLISCDVKPFDLRKSVNEEGLLDIDATLQTSENTEGCKIKAFVWSDMDDMRPIQYSATIY